MCKLVPVLRVVGFVFLCLAITACALGFVAPFWIRLPLDHGLGNDSSIMSPARMQGGDQEKTTTAALATSTHTSSGSGIPIVGDKLSGWLKNGSYQGLWVTCFHNLTCSCFWQDNFAMEKQFPGMGRA